MRRSNVERYSDVQLALVSFEDGATTSDLFSEYRIYHGVANKYIKIGIRKGHVHLAKETDPGTYKSTEMGILNCRYWLTLRERFKEMGISSKLDLDSEIFKNIIDPQLLESNMFKRTCELKFLYGRVKSSGRSLFEINIDFLRLLYEKKKPIKFGKLLQGTNTTGFKLEKLKKLTKLIKVEKYPGSGRYDGESHFSLETHGVSCIRSYEGYFYMFDLNELLGTMLKPLVLGSNRN